MLAQLIFGNSEFGPPARVRRGNQTGAHLAALHNPLVGLAGGAHGHKCLALSGDESQYFFHFPLSKRQQAQIVVQSCIGKGTLSSSGVDTNVGGVIGKHHE